MPKGYEPGSVEPRWVQAWEDAAVGHADASSSAKKFCMVIPPPNVTGSLHIGHALNVTIQDILARWKRMAGLDVLWLPGTDHAGIATQNVVERELAKEGVHRNDIGRAEFEERVWEWRREYGERILRQMRLGERALHLRLGLVQCGATRLRRAVRSRPDLPWRVSGQLVPAL
jgi:valyl-tRNA synthetase